VLYFQKGHYFKYFLNMDNNPNPYNFPDQQGQQSNVPPPPPTPETQVGIRSMQSDLESIKQSGGEAPQSQIINAPELATMGQQPEAAPQTNFRASESATPSPTFSSSPEVQPSSETPQSEEAITAKSPFGLKTILLIIGGLILAGGIGYGAYYLVSNLTSTPKISMPTANTNLPVPLVPTSTGKIATTTVPEIPAIPPLVHKSLILIPTKTESILVSLPGVSFESAIASSSQEKLLVGSVKDLSFVNASGTPLESADILGAYFGSGSVALSAFFEKDFTSWLYYDKTGGAKLGLILQLKPSVLFEQASSSVSAILGNLASNISSFFVSNPTVPTKVAFDNGVVESIPVRFLAYSVKNSDVFEYGWYNRSGTYYLFMVTSYNQAVDIVKRLKALLPLTQGQTSTSTGTTTQP
jgi:hypothetical protein